MKFTLVSTVFNEANRLNQTIGDLEKQTLRPNEIIITDAGSTDDTYDILLNWKRSSSIPITILRKTGCNVAEGRNIAIKNAAYDIIASTDFGCRFHPEWLHSIITPFNDPLVNVVGGSYTVIELDQDTLAAKAAYIMYNGYNININADNFIPSSRSIAYRKNVFEKIGGYCEWLTLAGDDFVFGKEILAHGYAIQKVNNQYVYWGRHKKAIAFYKEAYRYGQGEGEAKLNLKFFIKQGASLCLQFVFVLSLLLLLLMLITHKKPSVFVEVVFFMSVIGLKTFYSLFKAWLRYKSPKYNWQVLAMAFYLVVKVKMGYIKGYLKGFLKSSSEQKIQAHLLKERLQVQYCSK